MSKYQKYFLEMVSENEELFRNFRQIHDNYVIDQKTWREKFNTEGAKVVEVIREWEGRLCQHSEGGQYGKYSSNLADKFWEAVRENFKMIDFVGVR